MLFDKCSSHPSTKEFLLETNGKYREIDTTVAKIQRMRSVLLLGIQHQKMYWQYHPKPKLKAKLQRSE